MAIQKSVVRIIIQSGSHFVGNAISGKIGVPKDIIKLVEDIRYLLTNFMESRLEYCNRTVNRNVDVLAKMAHL